MGDMDPQAPIGEIVSSPGWVGHLNPETGRVLYGLVCWSHSCITDSSWVYEVSVFYASVVEHLWGFRDGKM